MNIGVILLFPSDVLVSICLLMGPLAGVVEVFKGAGTEFVVDGTCCWLGGAGGFKFKSSGASITIQPPWINGFPYKRS